MSLESSPKGGNGGSHQYLKDNNILAEKYIGLSIKMLNTLLEIPPVDSQRYLINFKGVSGLHYMYKVVDVDTLSSILISVLFKGLFFIIEQFTIYLY